MEPKRPPVATESINLPAVARLCVRRTEPPQSSLWRVAAVVAVITEIILREAEAAPVSGNREVLLSVQEQLIQLRLAAAVQPVQRPVSPRPQVPILHSQLLLFVTEVVAVATTAHSRVARVARVVARVEAVPAVHQLNQQVDVETLVEVQVASLVVLLAVVEVEVQGVPAPPRVVVTITTPREVMEKAALFQEQV